MTIKNTLTSIVLAGTLALGITGCTYYSQQYTYDGMIGADTVKFEVEKRILTNPKNILKVTKPDGRIIIYVDYYKDDLKLENVNITKDGKTTPYSCYDDVGKPVVAEGQKQFDDYLRQIKEIKISQGLNDLK